MASVPLASVPLASIRLASVRLEPLTTYKIHALLPKQGLSPHHPPQNGGRRRRRNWNTRSKAKRKRKRNGVGVTKNAAEIDAPYPIYRRRKKKLYFSLFPKRRRGKKANTTSFPNQQELKVWKRREGGRENGSQPRFLISHARFPIKKFLLLFLLFFSKFQVEDNVSFSFHLPLPLWRGERPKFIFIRLKAWDSSMFQRNLSRINYPFCCHVQLFTFHNWM